MKQFVLSILLFIGIAIPSLGQTTHFIPVWTGNGLDQMNIYVTYAAIDGVLLKEGDEIGVFDGTYCVGATARPLVLGTYIQVVCSLDDPTTTGVVDGYTVGNPFQLKIWDKAKGIEYATPITNVTYGSPTFEIGGTAMVTLEATSNKAPVALVSQTQVVDENAEVVVDGSMSTDPNGDVLSYAWIVSPSISGLDTSMAALSFIAPEVVANTLYTFTLKVSDGTLASTATTSVLVLNVNVKPVIEGPSSKDIKEDSLLVLTIDSVYYSDPDPAQTHKLYILSGANYQVNGDTIRPLKNFNGNLEVPIIVSDGVDNSDVFTLNVQVTPVNDAPVFLSTPPTSAINGKVYSYLINTYDADADAISINGVGLPSWLSIQTDANNNQVLTGTPNTTGSFTITLTASDGTANVSQNYTLKVTDLPSGIMAVTQELLPAKVGTAYVQKLRFATSSPDSLIVWLNNKPQWLSLANEVNGYVKMSITTTDTAVVFSGTPPVGSVSDFPVEVKYRDTKVQRSKYYSLKVIADNTAPKATNSTVVTDEDTKVLVVLQGTDDETPNNIGFSIIGQPVHGTLFALSSRLYIYTPESNFFGADSLKFEVSELQTNGLSAQGRVDITVNPVDDAPVILSWNQKYELTENGSVDVTGITMNDDIDGVNASSLTATAVFGPYRGTFNTSTFTYTPNAGFYGRDVVAIAAKELGDGELVSDPVVIFFKVNPVNQNPVLAADTVKLKEDTQVTFIPRIFDREDSIANLTFEFTSLPNNGTVEKDGYKIKFTPNANWFGLDSLSFVVIDPEGALSNEVKVYIVCSSVNDYPVAQSMEIDAANSTTVNLDFTSYVSDIETPDNLSIEFVLWDSTANIGYSVFGSQIEQTSGLNYVYTLGHNYGVDYIPYRVFDGTNTSLPALIHITNLKTTVKNAYPSKSSDTLIATSDYLDLTYGDTANLVFTVVYDGADLSTAPELVITNMESLAGYLETPQLLSFTQGNPLITYTAKYIAPPKISKGSSKARGNDTAVLFDKVGYKTRRGQSKGTYTDSSNVDTIYIGNLNRKVPTVLAPIDDISMNEGQTSQVDVYYSDPDTPHDQIVFAATSSVTGSTLSYANAEDGHKLLSVTPPVGYYGRMTISVSATDDTSSVHQQFMVDVNAVNQAPVITTVDSAYYLTDNSVDISAFIEDRETAEGNLTVSVTANPTSAADEIIYNDGVITIQPTSGYNQVFTFKIMVSDGQLTTEHNVKMINRATNAIPELDPISSVDVNEDNPAELSVIPTDADAVDQLSITFETNNADLVDESCFAVTPLLATGGVERTITITPKSNMNGAADVIVYVSDGIQKTAREFTLNVEPVNDAPSLVSIANQSMHNDETLSLNLEVTDPDSYQFTYGATSSNQNLQFEIIDNVLNITILNDYRGDATFTVTVEDDSQATGELTVNLSVLAPTGVPVVNRDEFSVYPNPVNDVVNILWKGTDAPYSVVKIYNIQGQLLQEKVVDLVKLGKNEIDVSSLSKGVYILQIQTGADKFNSKIIKQ